MKTNVSFQWISFAPVYEGGMGTKISGMANQPTVNQFLAGGLLKAPPRPHDLLVCMYHTPGH